MIKTALACSLVLLALPSVANGADLVARRAACSDAAKARITVRSSAGAEVYRLVVERRRAFVDKCMAEAGPSVVLPKPHHGGARESIAGEAAATPRATASPGRQPRRSRALASAALPNG